MHKVRGTILWIASLLPSAAAYADDAKTAPRDSEALPPVTLSLEHLNHEWEYGSRWQLSHPADAPAYFDQLSRPGVNVNFRNSDALARVSKLRNLSFLTFAEIGRARLFLGVNDNGIVGVHFRAFHRLGDERYLEVIRMPYLEKDQPAIETD